eukprot:gene25949-33383_t
MNGGCTLFRLTPEEALAGIPRNAALALGLQDQIGTLEADRAPGRARLPHRLQPASHPHPERTMTTLSLTPGQARLADWRHVIDGATVALTQTGAIAGAQAIVDDIVAAGTVTYGVNTGFGKLASVRIADDDLATLQRNLILSHAVGT